MGPVFVAAEKMVETRARTINTFFIIITPFSNCPPGSTKANDSFSGTASSAPAIPASTRISMFHDFLFLRPASIVLA
jgi:hypothetical protein